MDILVITGGIATGKSTFCALLQELGGDSVVIFDCDRCVHELLTTPAVGRTVSEALGAGLADNNGRLDRARLRDLVFDNPGRRRILEQILHPLVRKACAEALEEARFRPRVRCFAADVPLFYESDFPLTRDLVAVVACSPRTQRERLAARSGFGDGLMDSILAAQLPILEKADRADVVLWNGGSRESLRQQTEQFFTWLKTRPRK